MSLTANFNIWIICWFLYGLYFLLIMRHIILFLYTPDNFSYMLSIVYKRIVETKVGIIFSWRGHAFSSIRQLV